MTRKKRKKSLRRDKDEQMVLETSVQDLEKGARKVGESE